MEPHLRLQRMAQSAIILAFGLLLASYRGIPVIGLILLGLVVLYSFITQRTVFGRGALLVVPDDEGRQGGDEEANQEHRAN